MAVQPWKRKERRASAGNARLRPGESRDGNPVSATDGTANTNAGTPPEPKQPFDGPAHVTTLYNSR